MKSPPLSLAERALLAYGVNFPNHPRKWWFHAKLRRLIARDSNQEFDVERQRLRWSLNSSDFAHQELFWLGVKDPWEIYHLKDACRVDDVILDIGANFGYYALTLAAHLHERCHVLAMEPLPKNYSRLVRNIEANKLTSAVHARPLAVAESSQQGRIVEQPGNSGHAHFKATDGLEVPVTTIDDIVQSEQICRVDVIVLDVEGCEERALHGGKRTLEQHKPLVVVELWEPALATQKTTVDRVARLLQESEYRLFAPCKSSMQPLSVLPTGDQRVVAFCVHADSTRWRQWR